MAKRKQTIDGVKIEATVSRPIIDKLEGMVDEAWQLAAQEDLDPSDHQHYSNLVDLHQRAAALASVTDHHALPDILSSWTTMQMLYAEFVRDQVLEGTDKLQATVTANEATMAEHDGARQELKRVYGRIASGDSDDVREEGTIKRLRPQAVKYDNAKSARDEAQTTLDGVERAAGDLKAIIEMGADSIHFQLQPADVILDSLGKKRYESPEKVPFSVDGTVVADHFVQGVEPRKRRSKGNGYELGTIDPENVPGTIMDLLDLKEAVDRLEPGVYTSREIRDTLPEDFSLKPGALGGFLQRGQSLFGIKLLTSGGARSFEVADDVQTSSAQEFVAGVYASFGSDDAVCQGNDQGTIAKFYVKLAIDQLREVAESYNGMSRDDIQRAVYEAGFPIGSQSLGRNLGESKLADLGIEHREDKYWYIEVLPTGSQREVIAGAVNGIGTFKPEDIYGSLQKEGIHPFVIDVALDEGYKDIGLKVVSQDPLTYGPATAKAAAKRGKQTARRNLV